MITLRVGLTLCSTAAETKIFFEELKMALRKKFLVSDVIDLNWFLGIQIRIGANKIKISQEKYIHKHLESVGLRDAKTAFRPTLETVPISSVVSFKRE